MCEIQHHIVTRFWLHATLYHCVQEVESEDERVERLLAQLEQCNVELLAEFYAALENAGQCEIVKLLRQG